MRKNWRMRISSDRRGKITSGVMGKSKAGQDIPKSLDHFNVSKFPELIDAYGEKPNKLVIVFGIEDMNLFFQTEYCLWASSEKSTWKKRSCDGETCRHLVPETINGRVYNRGEEHECFNCGTDDCDLAPDEQCKCYTGFSAYVIDPRVGRLTQFTPYRFQTNSVNSGDNILSTLHTIFEQYGCIPRALPFELTVEMVEQQTDEGKNKFPIWYLKAWGTVEQINEFVQRTQLPTNEKNSIITDQSRLLSDSSDTVGVEVNDPYPDEEDYQAEKELVAKITGSEPEDIRVVDITEMRGVLSPVEIDETNMKQLVAYTVKMIMDMAGGNKEKGRRMLQTMTGHSSSAEFAKEPEKVITEKYNKTKDKYREFLTKQEADENQGSLL